MSDWTAVAAAGRPPQAPTGDRPLTPAAKAAADARSRAALLLAQTSASPAAAAADKARGRAALLLHSMSARMDAAGASSEGRGGGGGGWR